MKLVKKNLELNQTAGIGKLRFLNTSTKSLIYLLKPLFAFFTDISILKVESADYIDGEKSILVFQT